MLNHGLIHGDKPAPQSYNTSLSPFPEVADLTLPVARRIHATGARLPHSVDELFLHILDTKCTTEVEATNIGSSFATSFSLGNYGT